MKTARLQVATRGVSPDSIIRTICTLDSFVVADGPAAAAARTLFVVIADEDTTDAIDYRLIAAMHDPQSATLLQRVLSPLLAASEDTCLASPGLSRVS